MRVRRALIAVGLAVATATMAVAQTATDFAREANAHYDAGDYDASSAAYARSIEAGASNPITFYNAACSAALAGEIDVAFERLDGALARGWRDVPLTSTDPDLASLHDDPRFADVLTACRKADADFRASLGAPDLRDELLAMRQVDQAARGVGTDGPDPARMMAADSVHTARMKAIVAEHGWPTTRLVGDDGARAAWLLVQHADRHPAFQRECLTLMKAADPGEVDPVNLAYLTDRVLVNEGKPQVYGTQFWTVDGEMVPRPIADPAKVETLRAEVGMETMQATHLRMTGRDWDPGE